MKISYYSQPKQLEKLLKQQESSLVFLTTLIQEAPFYKAPFSAETSAALKKFSELKLPSYERICVVGLGGSSLGTKALAHACGVRNMDFLDNVDPQFVEEYLANAPLQKTLFFIVSKSGETVEVDALTRILLAKKIDPKKIIGICENESSSLVSLLKKNGVTIFFECSNVVPGRFSVLTQVGLLPLMASGIDCRGLLTQLKKVDCVSAVKLAYATGWHYQRGKNILPLFIYSESLNYFADWYIQLLAESIGKKKNIGITPLKAVGVKDQHAQLQLFLDGPLDKLYIFVKQEFAERTKIAGQKYNLTELFNAEYKGVIGAFAKKKLPTIELNVGEKMAEAVMQLFFFFEIHVAALGMLFNINYENQPAVELSKSITRSVLIK